MYVKLLPLVVMQLQKDSYEKAFTNCILWRPCIEWSRPPIVKDITSLCMSAHKHSNTAIFQDEKKLLQIQTDLKQVLVVMFTGSAG